MHVPRHFGKAGGNLPDAMETVNKFGARVGVECVPARGLPD